MLRATLGGVEVEMLKLILIVRKLPISKGLKLSLKRYLIDRAYAKDIVAAEKAQKGRSEIVAIHNAHRHEIEMNTEEEEAYFTQKLLQRARKLRVPIPHRYSGKYEINSDFWFEGQYFGSWILTTKGVATLREEIRNEVKARYETRSHWVIWVSALTGLLGAATGLVAVLSKSAP
jgi:hypothetical protein